MAVRSHLIAAALMTVASSGAASLWADRADRDVRNALLRAFPGSEVHISGIWTNPISGRVAVRGLTVRMDRATLDVGALDFSPGRSLPSLITTAHAAAVDEKMQSSSGSRAGAPGGKASADNITYSSDGTTAHMSHVEISGTRLDDAALQKLLDPNGAASVETRLRQLTAASIVISEVKIDRSQPMGEVHWTGKQMLLANVVDGRASAASIGPSSLAVRNGADAGNADVAGQEFRGLDLGGIAHAFGAAQTVGSEPLQPLCDAWTANGLRYADVTHDRVFTLATAKAMGVKGRASQADTADGGVRPREIGAASIADVARSIAFQSLELNEGATTPASQSSPKGITSRFGKLVVTGVNSDQTIGSIDLKNYDIDHFPFADGDDHLSIAAARAEGFHLKSPLRTGGFWQPSLDKLAVNDVSLRITPTGNDGDKHPTVVTLKHAGLSAPGAATNPIPAKAASDFEGLAFDPLSNGPMHLLADLGYAHVDLSGSSDDTFDAAANVFRLENFDVDGAGLGSLHLAVEFGNVSPAVTSPDPTLQKNAIAAVLLREVDLSLKNDGLIGRAIVQRAKTDGRTVPDERSFLQQLVTTTLPALIGNPPKLQPLEAALAQFIADPKSIRVSIKSPHGLGAADLAASNPLDILDMLQIEAAANQ